MNNTDENNAIKSVVKSNIVPVRTSTCKNTIDELSAILDNAIVGCSESQKKLIEYSFADKILASLAIHEESLKDHALIECLSATCHISKSLLSARLKSLRANFRIAKDVKSFCDTYLLSDSDNKVRRSELVAKYRTFASDNNLKRLNTNDLIKEIQKFIPCTIINETTFNGDEPDVLVAGLKIKNRYGF